MAIYKEDLVNIDLENGNIFRSFLTHTIGSGDNSANRFGVKVYRAGVAEDLSGCSCQAIFMNNAGVNIALTSYGTVSGNVAYVTLPQACYNVEGQFCLAIKLVKSGVTVTSRIVDGVVCNTGTTGSVAPTTSVPTYQEILAQYAAMVAATAAANTAIAEEFDATKNYPAGKLVINDGVLYLLPEGHEGGVLWPATTKTATNLGDQVTGLKSAIDGISNEVGSLADMSLKSGEYSLTWGQGDLDKSSGGPLSSDYAVRANFITFTNESMILINCNTLIISVYEYTENQASGFVYVTMGTTGKIAVPIKQGYYYRFTAKKADGSSITPSDSTLSGVTVVGIKNSMAIIDYAEKYTDGMIVNIADMLPMAIPVTTSAMFTKKDSMSAGINGYGQIGLSSNNSYDTYYYVFDIDAKVYFSANTYTYYVALCYGENYTGYDASHLYCSNGQRKRSSENNLPTIENPVTIHAGDVIAITVAKGNTIGIYGIRFAVKFSQSAEAEIREIALTKTPMVVYDGTAGTYNTERLYIYLPTKTGYARFNFEHYIRADTNADIWLEHPVYAVDNSLTERFAITTDGEFECAIKIDGAPDFMGGSAHGSEVMQSIRFFVDGKECLPSTLTTLQNFETLRILEQSILYNPSDETTQAAIHGKEYIYSDGKLVINQSVKWLGTFNLSTSYLAMLPIAQTVSPYYCPNDNYKIYETEEEYIRRGKISSVLTWSDDYGISVRFAIPLWDIDGTGITESGTFLITNNSSTTYNKEYYICTSGGSVSTGDLWRTTTEYVFEIGDSN